MYNLQCNADFIGQKTYTIFNFDNNGKLFIVIKCRHLCTGLWLINTSHPYVLRQLTLLI